MLNFRARLWEVLKDLSTFAACLALSWAVIAVSAGAAPLLIEYFEIEVTRPPDWGLGLILFMLSVVPGSLVEVYFYEKQQENWRIGYVTLFVAGLYQPIVCAIKPGSIDFMASLASLPETLAVIALALFLGLSLAVFDLGRFVVRRLFPRKEAAPC